MRYAILLLLVLVSISAHADNPEYYSVGEKAAATDTLRGQLAAAAGNEDAEVYDGVNAGGEKGYVISLSTSIEGKLVRADRAIFLVTKKGETENLFDPYKIKYRNWVLYRDVRVGVARSQTAGGPVFFESLCGGQFAKVCRLSFDGEIPKINF